MTNKETVQSGSTVVLSFTLKLEDGTLLDSADKNDPVSFSMGDGTLYQNLETCLMGMAAGENNRFELSPESAFGYSDPNGVQTLNASDFPQSLKLEEGLIIEFGLPNDESVAGMIKEIQEDQVIVDFNHPLAGHAIIFDVEILSVQHGEK